MKPITNMKLMNLNISFTPLFFDPYVQKVNGIRNLEFGFRNYLTPPTPAPPEEGRGGEGRGGDSGGFLQ
jgi:hypothetical protein